MGIESMRGMVPQAFFRNAGCREHQRWKCPMLNVENSLSVQALFLLLLHTIYLFSVVALETKYFLHESAFYPDKSSESAQRNRIFFNPRSRVVKGLVRPGPKPKNANHWCSQNPGASNVAFLAIIEF